MRQLIGPKGGLPTLKGDLLKFGGIAQLGLSRHHEGRGDQRTHQADDGNSKGTASSSSSDAVDPKAKAASKKGAKPKKQSSPPPRPPAEPSLATATTSNEVQEMLAQQELRFQVNDGPDDAAHDVYATGANKWRPSGIHGRGDERDQ